MINHFLRNESGLINLSFLIVSMQDHDKERERRIYKNGISKKEKMGWFEEGIELNGAKATIVAVSTNDSQIRLALRWMKGWFPLGKKYVYMVY